MKWSLGNGFLTFFMLRCLQLPSLGLAHRATGRTRPQTEATGVTEKVELKVAGELRWPRQASWSSKEPCRSEGEGAVSLRL